MSKDISVSLMNKVTSYDISLEPICKAHLEQLAVNLRAADRQELWACYQKPILESLLYCWQCSSESWALCYRGQVAAAGGLEPVSLLGNRACVWLWTSRLVTHCPLAFWKVSRCLLAHFQRQYPVLYAACEEDYKIAQRYLVRLGAQRKPEPVFLADPHIRFYIYEFAPVVQRNKQ